MRRTIPCTSAMVCPTFLLYGMDDTAIGLGLATVMVGAFDDQTVQQILLKNSNGYPLCIMPVGRVR